MMVVLDCLVCRIASCDVIWQLWSAVYEQSCYARDGVNESGLGAENPYLLERIYDEYMQSRSVPVEEAQRARLRILRAELNELRAAAQKKSRDVNDGVWSARFELSGIPQAAFDWREDTQELLLILFGRSI